MEVSGEAADLVMKEGVQISEEAIKLLARGAKNLAALLYALAKDQKKLYGKVSMNRLLSEQRPIEVLPLRTEDFEDFKQRAKKVGLLFSAILSMFGDRIGKLLLKQAVEQNVCNHILASDTDIDAQTYQQMRGKSYQEVLRTNGQISFPEVLRQKSRW